MPREFIPAQQAYPVLVPGGLRVAGRLDVTDCLAWSKIWTFDRFQAWFKNARFRVTVEISARTLIGPALERVCASPCLPGRTSVPREPSVPQKIQPVGVRLTRQEDTG